MCIYVYYVKHNIVVLYMYITHFTIFLKKIFTQKSETVEDIMKEKFRDKSKDVQVNRTFIFGLK